MAGKPHARALLAPEERSALRALLRKRGELAARQAFGGLDVRTLMRASIGVPLSEESIRTIRERWPHAVQKMAG